MSINIWLKERNRIQISNDDIYWNGTEQVDRTNTKRTGHQQQHYDLTMRKKQKTMAFCDDAKLWLGDNKRYARASTRCIESTANSNQSDIDTILNVSTRKTTHSWPIICRQSNRYESDENTEDSNDYDDANTTDNDDDGDYDYDDSDNETIYIRKNRCHKPNPASAATTFIDNLSCRKYLVADYNPKKHSNDYYYTSTITSVVNAQSDFPLSLKLSSSAGRLTRNSIAPLMSPQTHTPRTSTALHHDTNVSAAISAAAAAASMDQTTCTAPPPILFLLLTLLTTLSATGLLCLAVMTDHWEIIRWDRNLLDHLTTNTSNQLYWHLDEKVARLTFARK